MSKLANKKKESSFMIEPGDVVLVRGDRFVSKAIRFFMDRYRKRLKIEKRKLFNHAAMVIEIWDTLWVAEANKRGIEIRSFNRAYANKLNKIKVLRPKKSYSKLEKKGISKVAAAYAFDPTRYDFFSFWYQIRMIEGTKVKDGKVIRRWRGPRGKKAENRLYCTEAIATWANKVRPTTFNEQWSINPLDIELNKYYKVIYDGTL